MNRKINKKMYYRLAVLFISIALLLPGSALAARTTVEGKIAGANCVAAKGMCPMKANDAHLALERDFVLSAADGKYFFLPNISRSQKASYVSKPVRITGELNGQSLLVATIELKENGKYREVWNWEKITAELGRGN
mgnify:CR=1 FL=1